MLADFWPANFPTHSGVNKKASIICLGIQGGPDEENGGYKNM